MIFQSVLIASALHSASSFTPHHVQNHRLSSFVQPSGTVLTARLRKKKSNKNGIQSVGAQAVTDSVESTVKETTDHEKGLNGVNHSEANGSKSEESVEEADEEVNENLVFDEANMAKAIQMAESTYVLVKRDPCNC
jgi:hypothetical protein